MTLIEKLFTNLARQIGTLFGALIGAYVLTLFGLGFWHALQIETLWLLAILLNPLHL